MEHYVITIGREYGSRGMEIGLKLSQSLNIPVYYKDLAKMAAKRMGLDENVILDVDETVSVNLASVFSREGSKTKSLQDQLFDCEKTIMQEIVLKESCIMVGHCASYILKQHPHLLNVFVYAPYSVRFERIQEEHEDLSTDEVEMLIDTIDKNRHNYYKHYTKQNRGSRVNRQIQIDSSILGVDGTAKLIEEAVKMRFQLEGKEEGKDEDKDN